MKILFFQPTLTITGGIDRWAVTLANEFAKEHTVAILSCYPVDPRLSSVENSEVHTLRERHTHTAWSKIIKVFSRASKLNMYLAKHPTDIIIASADGICISAVLANLFNGHRAKLICVIHEQIGFAPRYTQFLLRMLLPFADAVVGVSTGITTDIRHHTKRAKLRTILNPIALSDLQQHAADDIPEKELFEKNPTFMAGGRLVRSKAHYRLIRAFAHAYEKNTDIRLAIVGDGDEKDSLKRLADELGVKEAVSFLGEKIYVAPYLARAEAMICTASYEPFGIFFIEALACGTPMISLDCDYGPREILEVHKKVSETTPTTCGILIPYATDEAMEEILGETLATFKKKDYAKGDLVKRASDFDVATIIRSWKTLFGKI